ncbi:hypothetical protein A1D22_01300 [Pasteurellaceae bacterium LFhippo2]|nr:hypothetical protein [Pasteurellaceae bacterium LFhippo2]
MSKLVDFLEQKGPDHKGRMISDIWGFEHFYLESIHDFIQWIFPLNVASNSKRSSPILTEADCEHIRQSEVAQRSLLKSFEIMLDFWNLKQQDNQIVPKQLFDPMNLRHFWIRRTNHNQLRMTRVIKSLAMLGRVDLARQFQQGILEIAKDTAINPETVEIWKKAI